MSKKITIIDYGMGNLYSVQNALRSIGAEPVVTSDAAVIEMCIRDSCLRVAFSGVRPLSESTADVKKSFTGTAKDTLHL